MQTTSKAVPAKGSVLGAILLITGCCVGAGMLGLPIVTGVIGFVPAVAVFVLSWLFMCATALLLLEVNLWFASSDISLITMADRTLGSAGKIVAWGCFLFLFYALGVAYIGASGKLFAGFWMLLFGTQLSTAVGSILIALLFGISVFLGTHITDLFNRYLMLGLVAAYVVMIALGAPHIDVANWEHRDWPSALMVVPVIIISFGFHNMVPSLTTYLDGNRRKLTTALLVGSSLPLLIYLIWEGLILGLVPVEGIKAAFNREHMATETLHQAVGGSFIVHIADAFAFFAIVTSLLGNSLSFVDFLADGLRVDKQGMKKLGLCALVILPPLTFSLIYPNIFLSALSYAGAFGALILFGILPALMVWSGRYRKGYSGVHLLPGGKFSLMLIMSFASLVILLQLWEECTKRGLFLP